MEVYATNIESPEPENSITANLNEHQECVWWKLRTMLEKFLIGLWIILSLLLFGIIIALTEVDVYKNSINSSVCLSKSCIQAAARILKTIDETVSPCDNFYQFSCGGWLKSVVIPDEDNVISVFSTIQHEIDLKQKANLETPINENDSMIVKNIKNFYSSCLNKKAALNSSTQLLQVLKELGGWPVLEGINWNKSNFDWIETFSRIRSLGFKHQFFLHIRVAPNINRNTKYAIYFSEPTFGGLARSDLRLGLKNKRVISYHKFMVETAVALGANRTLAEYDMGLALKLEISIARTPQDTNQFQTLTLRDIEQIAPNIDWVDLINSVLLTNFTVDETETIIIQANSPTKQLDSIFYNVQNKNPRTLANFILWRVVVQSLWTFDDKFLNLMEEFYTESRPQRQKLSRWKTCLYFLTNNLNSGMSYLFIKDQLLKNKKRELATEIVSTIHQTFIKKLDTVDWMDEETRCSAKYKAKAINKFVGFSDHLLNENFLDKFYEELENLVPDNLFANVLKVQKWSFNMLYSKLIQHNNRADWPQNLNLAIVNAYYSPLSNSIKIPHGLLQGALFNADQPNYLNYGALGYVIGHEITHGFDTRGGQFDKHGNVRDWWDINTKQTFNEKGNCMISQYESFNLSYGLKMNGRTTLPENIADNGGIKEAFRGYQEYIKTHGPELPLPGLKYSPLQLFWISAANIWCRKYTPDGYKHFVKHFAHSLPKYRVNIPFSNSEEFSQIFNCSEGTHMNPIKKCAIW